MPGVASATVASSIPPFGGIRTEVEVAGRTHAERWEALYQLCSEGYFETLGQRPLRGRMLSAQDVADGRKVAVVNETLAIPWWPSGTSNYGGVIAKASPSNKAFTSPIIRPRRSSMPTGPSHELSALVSRRLQDEYETVRAKVHRQVDNLTDD